MTFYARLGVGMFVAMILVGCSRKLIGQDGTGGTAAAIGGRGGDAGGAPGAAGAAGAAGAVAPAGAGGIGTAGSNGSGAGGAGVATGTGGAPPGCPPNSAACLTAGTQCLSADSLLTCSRAEDCFIASTAACGANLVCERHAPAACADPQWVAWPMPNGKDDVAAGAPNEMSFTDNGDGTVTDNVTHLMWQQASQLDNWEWAVAGRMCRDLVLAGHDDWRMPSMIELVSIADLGKSNPSIDAKYFPATPADFFWSSTVWGTSPTSVAAVSFARGNTAERPMTGMPAFVRCVR